MVSGHHIRPAPTVFTTVFTFHIRKNSLCLLLDLQGFPSALKNGDWLHRVGK